MTDLQPKYHVSFTPKHVKKYDEKLYDILYQRYYRKRE
jgi:hypothetical protein